MSRKWSLIILALLVACGMLFINCSSGGDDDDDNDTADDDFGDDDAVDDDVADDDVVDDDTADDDVVDDDTADDDTADDDTADDDTADDDTTPEYDYFEDFESYTVDDPPGGGWDVSGLAGGATATIMTLAKDGVGQGLKLSDINSAAGGAVISPVANTLFATPFQIDWDWYWVSGDGMALQIIPAEGATLAWTLSVDFYMGHVEAVTSAGGGTWVTCVASVDFGQWYKFSAVVDPVAKTYSVLIDGAATDCTDLDFLEMTAAPDKLAFTMYTDVNGGETHVDNLGLLVQ